MFSHKWYLSDVWWRLVSIWIAFISTIIITQSDKLFILHLFTHSCWNQTRFHLYCLMPILLLAEVTLCKTCDYNEKITRYCVSHRHNFRTLMTPCTLVEVYRCFGGMHCLHLQIILCCLLVWSTPQTRSWRSELSFEASGNFYQTTQCCVPRGSVLPSPCHENLNSYILRSVHVMLKHLWSVVCSPMQSLSW
jgi:hypothetical protein